MRLTVEGGSVHAAWDHMGSYQALVIEKEGGGAIRSGDIIFLRAHTGKRLTVEGDVVHFLWDHRGGWQALTIEKEGGGPIYPGDGITLTAHTGKQLTVEGEAVHAKWGHRGMWQTFTVEQQADPAPTPAPTPSGSAPGAPCDSACGPSVQAVEERVTALERELRALREQMNTPTASPGPSPPFINFTDNATSGDSYIPRERYVHCYRSSWSGQGQNYWSAAREDPYWGCNNQMTAYVGDVLLFRYAVWQQVWRIPSADCPLQSLEELAGAGGTVLIGDKNAGGGDPNSDSFANQVRYHLTEAGTYYFSGTDQLCRGQTNNNGHTHFLRMQIEVIAPTVDVAPGPQGVDVKQLTGAVGILQVPFSEMDTVNGLLQEIREGKVRALDRKLLQRLSAASQNVLLMEMTHALSLRTDLLARAGPSWPLLGSDEGQAGSAPYLPRERYVHCKWNDWSKQAINFWRPFNQDEFWGCNNNNMTAYVGDVLVFKYPAWLEVWKIPSPACPQPSLVDSGALLIGDRGIGGGIPGEDNWPNTVRYRLSEAGKLYFTATDEYCNGRTNSDGSVSKLKVQVTVLDPAETVAGAAGGGDAAASSEAVQKLTGIVQALSRSLAVYQSSVEQLTRADGGSGITQVRSYTGGVEPYQEPSHTSWGVAAIHDHANYADMVGIGEFGAVLNGVSFWTRHNDYKLEKPAAAGSQYHATEPVTLPEVPPAVLEKGTLQGQIDEMREWFKAWHSQDYSVRDYRPYFQAVLCYLEGAWISDNGNLAEPFASHRHEVAASTWRELHDRMRFLLNSGRKNTLENMPYLPTSVRRMQSNGTEPELANFEYRIACHPLQQDLPTSRFRVEADLHTQLFAGARTTAEVEASRQARFEVHPATSDEYTPGNNGQQATPWPASWKRYSFLDELMEQVPGKDGYGANLTDDALGETCMHFSGDQPLNAAYYSRFYSMSTADAMGRSIRKRGFNDPHLWAARTTQARVSKLDMQGEHPAEQGWSYAVPLEVVYLTPLGRWNPYDLPHCGEGEDCSRVAGGGRNGGFDPATAYDGTSVDNYYRTPETFFSGAKLADADPADTSSSAVGVLDGSGQVRRVMASGPWTMLPEITGLGRIRLRYPIMPIHKHGSTEWKEIKALEEVIRAGHGSAASGVREDLFGVTLLLSGGGTSHQHSIAIQPAQLEQFTDGKTVTEWSSLANGHNHRVTISRSTNGGVEVFVMDQCDGRSAGDPCNDGHSSITQLEF